MANTTNGRPRSAFDELGFKQSVEALVMQTQALYLEDSIPWVLGYSGGKDSTAVLQLVWTALARLPPEHRTKPVHVISTDTLVENPIVATWVNNSLDCMQRAAVEQNLPIKPHRLTPATVDTFWVNLIGRGYPAPRHKFRWCTERMKIKPSNTFIRDMVKANGEAILVLGTRKAESAQRHATMAKYEQKRLRDGLSPNASLPNCLVYSPVEQWSNDDVWLYLMQVSNPWGYRNKELLTMYQGASADGECPLVVDTTTPSCGDSRFGCWVCTLVDQDRSMTAMIQNDAEKEWMLPLLELRNELDVRDVETGHKNDRHLRDFRRMNGRIQIHRERLVHGPYTQQAREAWLRKLLEAQRWLQEHGPDTVREMVLITLDELREIRRIWVAEKHEVEDRLPHVYEEALGVAYPDGTFDDRQVFGVEEMELLRQLCGDDRMQYEMVRELLDVERKFRTMARRAGLYGDLERAVRRSFYEGADDALDFALRRNSALEDARGWEPAPLELVGSPAELADEELSRRLTEAEAAS